MWGDRDRIIDQINMFFFYKVRLNVRRITKSLSAALHQRGVGSSGGKATTGYPATRSCAHDEHENTESELIQLFVHSLAGVDRLACSSTLR